ncbi:MAG: CHAT domain-containing tetratricopeptide repeat protein [Planctomycetota bacterium]
MLLLASLVLVSLDALSRQPGGGPLAAEGLDGDEGSEDEVLELLIWQLEQGDLDGTRALLTEILEPGAQALVADRDEGAALALLTGLDAIAERLSDPRAQLEVREEIHRRLEASRDSGDSDLIAAKVSLAMTRAELGDLAGALALEEQVHAARERLLRPDHPDLLDAKHNLAVTRYLLGDLAGALVLQEQVFASREPLASPDDPDLLRAKENLALTRGDLGDLEGELALEEQVHAARERLLAPDHPDLLTTKHNLAVMRRQLGDLEGALALHEYVHAANERLLPPDHPSLLDAKLSLGATRGELGDLEGALALEEYVHAARTRLLPPNHPALLKAKQNLAATRNQLGDHEGAHELFESVHTARERLLPPEHPDLLSTKLNLAVARGQLGDFEGAHELFEEVHAARERLLDPGHPDLMLAKASLAWTSAELGDLEGALTLEEQVYAASERLLGPNHPRSLMAKGNLAGTRAELGDLVGALALEEQVHAAWQRISEPGQPGLLIAKENLAATRAELGDLEGALEIAASLADAATEFVVSGLAAPPREARATARAVAQRLAKGRIWRRCQRVPATVLESYTRAFETTRHVATARFDLGSGVGLEDDRLAELRGAVAAAKRALDEHMTRAPHLPDRPEGQPEEVWRQARHASQAEWNRRLAQLSMDRDAREKELLALRGGSRSHVTSIDPARVSAALEEGDIAVGLQRIACWKWGPDGRQHTDAEEHYVAYALAAGGQAAEIDLGLATDIDVLVERWRNALGASLGSRRGFGTPSPASARTIEIDESKAGRALRRVLLDPLVATCEIEPGARLCLCLDDSLHAIPLDALPLEASTDRPATAEFGSDVVRVGDVYNVRLDVSFARLIAPDPRTEASDSLLIVGDIDYFDVNGDVTVERGALEERLLAQVASVDRAGGWGDWVALPGASEEVAAIQGLAQEALEVEPVMLGADAVTADALATAAAGKKHVHIATHGWFMPESVRSMIDHDPGDERMGLLGTERTVIGFAPLALCGLVLSGANMAETPGELAERLLTAMELSNFDLWDCELAVLSACETNVGIARAGQGIQSLQTALHQAGARASVTSLWRVDDEATRDLMRAFYENLWETGMGKAEALWDAKCQMRRRGEPVRHWAGWVLVGDPD